MGIKSGFDQLFFVLGGALQHLWPGLPEVGQRSAQSTSQNRRVEATMTLWGLEPETSASLLKPNLGPLRFLGLRYADVAPPFLRAGRSAMRPAHAPTV